MAIYQDENLVKRAYKKIAYTPEMVDELRKCYDPINGPMYFMESFMKVQHPTKGRVNFKAYDYQVDLIDTYHNYNRSCNMLGRQLGKSTCAAGYLLWFAMFNDDVTVLVAAHKYDGAQEIMYRARYAYESIPDHIRAGVISYNKRSIEFDNGSRIVSTTTTENTGRGMSLSLIFLDEFAAVNPSIAKDLWTSLSPTLATGGRCIITSTPSSDEDQFAGIWFGANDTIDSSGNEQPIGKNGFRAYSAIWSAHPDRDQEWADKEIASIGEDRFAREHACQFVSFEETLLNPIKLSLMKPSPEINKTGQVRWYEPIIPTNTYVIALDPSMGTGGDNAAIQVFELPSLKQVAEWHHNKTCIEDQVRILRRIGEEIYAQGKPEIYWSVESNSLGEAALVVIRETGEERFAGSMLHDPKNKLAGTRKRGGFVTTNRSKLEACAKLKYLVEAGKIKVNSKFLLTEMKSFVSKNNSYEARTGQTDDLVMATLLFLRMAEFIASWDDVAYQNINSSVISDDENPFDSPMPVFI